VNTAPDLSEDSRDLTLKRDPDRAIELRELHPEVTPAWHFNKDIMILVYTAILLVVI
jgi:predicted DNA-binding protein (MmcQ/YjbR family)